VRSLRFCFIDVITGERIMHTDRTIQLQILAALEGEPGIDVAHIGVTVNKGVVTLDGVVETLSGKSAAEDAARHVDGVRAVASDLEVRPNHTTHRSDSALADAVVNALASRCAVPLDAIQAIITEGRVALTGAVTWERQKTAAERAVQQLHGVKSVVNNIIVMPHARVEDVKSRIERTFRLNADLDAQNVRVEIHGGVVVLTGTVRSLGERQQAERAVWSAPGVTKLDDRMLVAPESSWQTAPAGQGRPAGEFSAQAGGIPQARCSD
jgi:osmotically-inducible protein OsmY